MHLINHNATAAPQWHWTDAEISRALSATNQSASLFSVRTPRHTTTLAAGLHMHMKRTIAGHPSDIKRLDSAMTAVGEYLDDRATKTERTTTCKS